MTLSRETQHEITFLKMAAIELRNISAEAPDVASRLIVIAQQLEAEAAAIERARLQRGGEWSRTRLTQHKILYFRSRAKLSSTLASTS